MEPIQGYTLQQHKSKSSKQFSTKQYVTNPSCISASDNSPIKFYKKDEEYGEFSNFYSSKFELDGSEWRTVEHYFQAQKFVSTNPAYAEQIRDCNTPFDAMRLGKFRGVKICSDCEDIKYKVMLKALGKKFQDERLKKLLISTGDRKLIENSMIDYVWGIGEKGTGSNLLGKALMEVRESLKIEKN